MQEASFKGYRLGVGWGGGIILNEIVKDGTRLWDYFQDQKRKLFGLKSDLKEICFAAIAGPFSQTPKLCVQTRA